jgi:hypothetical protein
MTVNERCQKIEEIASEMKIKLRGLLGTELMRFSKKMRLMPLNELEREYGPPPGYAESDAASTDVENIDSTMPQTVIKGSHGEPKEAANVMFSARCHVMLTNKCVFLMKGQLQVRCHPPQLGLP